MARHGRIARDLPLVNRNTMNAHMGVGEILSPVNKADYYVRPEVPLYTEMPHGDQPHMSEFQLVSSNGPLTDVLDENIGSAPHVPSPEHFSKRLMVNEKPYSSQEDGTSSIAYIVNKSSASSLLRGHMYNAVHSTDKPNKFHHIKPRSSSRVVDGSSLEGVSSHLRSSMGGRSFSQTSKQCECDNCRRKPFLDDESFIEDISRGGLDRTPVPGRSSSDLHISSGDSSNLPIDIRDAGVVKTALTETETVMEHDSEIFKLNDETSEHRRILDMVSVRCNIANSYLEDRPCIRPVSRLKNFVDTFTKGLPHNQDGFVDKREMLKLIAALNTRDIERLSKIRLGSQARLVNPSAAWSQNLIGKSSNSYRYSKPPPFYSDRMAAQMAELYCMSLSRDIHFKEYNTSPVIADCCRYLNDLRSCPQVKGKVTPYNIYRGPMNGDLQGPYISQLLYKDIMVCGVVQEQKYPSSLEGYDFMKTWDVAVQAQNGIISEDPAPTRKHPRYITTGRDLAFYVRTDNHCQTFFNVSALLLDMNVPMNPGIAKLLNDNPVESFFVNFGLPDIQGTLGTVTRSSLLSAWYVKWNTLFLRPEAYAIEVERVYRNSRNKYGVSHELLINPVIEAVRSRNGSALLTQVYEGGAPLHPSTPSGHAAIAGACATVLKFFFDTNYEMDVYEPDNDGNDLVKTGKLTTLGEEINKLACNMAIGRNWAGVNYYMDSISGLKRGEKAALSCLNELIYRYPSPVSVNISRFNDSITTVHN